MVHGTRDEIVPIWHGQELHRLSPAPYHPYWVEGGQHNDLEVRAARSVWRPAGWARGSVVRASQTADATTTASLAWLKALQSQKFRLFLAQIIVVLRRIWHGQAERIDSIRYI